MGMKKPQVSDSQYGRFECTSERQTENYLELMTASEFSDSSLRPRKTGCFRSFMNLLFAKVIGRLCCCGKHHNLLCRQIIFPVFDFLFCLYKLIRSYL